MMNNDDLETTVNPTTQGIVKDIFPLPIEYLLLSLYTILICFGIFGNSLVCYLFASKKVQHKPFNILLLNLSIADLSADLFVIPYVFIDLKELRHLSSKNANLACAFTIGQTPFWMVTAVSLLSICFISATRYLQVKYPVAHSRVTSHRGMIIFIIMVWLIGVAIPFPNFFSFVYNPNAAVCERKWPAGFNGRIYSAVTTVIVFVVPIVSLMFTFFSTARTLQRLPTNDEESNPLLNSNTVVTRKNAIKLLGCLIIVFCILWSPFFIYWILSRAVPHVFPKGTEGNYSRMKVIRCSILVALCNTVADPAIYALRGEEFRNGFKDTMKIISTSLSKYGHGYGSEDGMKKNTA